MKIFKLIFIFLTLFVQSIYSQDSFFTELDYYIDWKNEIYTIETKEEKNLGQVIEHSSLLKNNLELHSYLENPIVEFLIDNILNGTLEVFNTENKRLSKEQLNRSIYWQRDMNPHSEDSIVSYDISKIKQLKIMQEWRIDENGNIFNKINEVIPIRIDENNISIRMFRIKFQNTFQAEISNPEVSYIRQIYNKWNSSKFPFLDFKKILKVTNENFVEMKMHTPLDVNNLKVSDPNKFFSKKYQDLNNKTGNLIDDSHGFGIYQYLYINVEQKTINSKFLAASPLITVVDELGKVKYITSSFFKINGE